MDDRKTTTAETLLLCATVVFGVLVTPVLAIIGLPLAAAGTAGLAYRGRIGAAAIALAIGATGVVALVPVEAVYMVPAVLMVATAVVTLPKVNVQVVAGFMTVVLGVAYGVQEYLIMRAQHETPVSFLTKAIGATTSGSAMTLADKQAARDFVNLLVTLMPMASFMVGLVTAIAIVVAVVWAAKRSGREVQVPALGALDLTPHVMWPFILGLLALAASYGPLSYSALLRIIGLNLLLSVRVLFALQGFGVSAGLLERAHFGLGVRILALAALAALDVFTLAVSFAGLLDFWANFRKLPRDGATPQAPSAAISDS